MSESEDWPTPDPEGNPKTCPECGGRGWVDNRCLTPNHSHLCTYCNGRGFTAAGNDCTACQGTGNINVRLEDKNPCPLCQGAGVYPVPESMSMKEFAYNPSNRDR